MDANVVFHYRFEEGANGATIPTLIDSGPNALNGSIVSTVTYTDDVAPFVGAGGLAMDNTGDFNYAQVGDNAAMHLQEFTLELFVRPNEPYGSGGGADPHVLVTKKIQESGTFINSWGMEYSPGSNYFNGAISFTAGSGVLVQSDGSFGGGVWYHVALTLDRDVSGSTDALTLFVDGVQVDQAMGDYPALTYTSEEFLIGAGNFAGSPTGTFRRNFNGQIDEVRLSDAALDPGEFLNTTPIPEPSTYVLLALGLAGAAFAVRRRRQ